MSYLVVDLKHNLSAKFMVNLAVVRLRLGISWLSIAFSQKSKVDLVAKYSTLTLKTHSVQKGLHKWHEESAWILK